MSGPQRAVFQEAGGSGFGPVSLVMVRITTTYTGNKKCELVHPEGATLRTDAPKDIGGDASAFSPTDLVAAGLASCILTTIAMWGERHGLDISGARASVEKHMAQPPAPRRIAKLPVVVEVPSRAVPAEMRERMEAIGHKCPVHASLHPEVEAPIEYRYV
ncbi:MAG: OsmC family protein [Planctomycetota bacterium]|nr:OsmC family protein [Planctomycetota bacterium]